ncbi:MAG: hypothetical protein E7253_10720 [Lachnospiraceae bacterium]|nr:hypothetical protein [Lachnospiraceae bacterium]
MARNYLKKDLGEGYYLQYWEKSNGIGGYHPVGMNLYKEDVLINEITDKWGYFLEFPGTLPGSWKSKLAGGFEEAMNFVFSAGKMEEGRFRLGWMVQPDGRYYADEDGFGEEPDEEIWLYAYVSKEGRFLTDFAENVEEL